jgi:hypothetical protein
MKSAISMTATVGVVLLATPVSAYAYLDPGTGSMVLQIAIGGVLAVVATSKLYWRRLTSLFQSKPKNGVTDRTR